MRHTIFIIITILFTCLFPVFGEYVPSTSQEQDLYNKLVVEFKKLDIQKKDVSDILATFEKPLIVSFPCDDTDLNKLVVSVIKTKLAKFDEYQHEGSIILGGTYSWQCTVTKSEGKVTIDCDNELKLNPSILVADTEKDPRIKNVENLVLLYHELLHGQLMIDAIKSSEIWKNDVCNKPPQGKIDYSYSDKNHKIINPLQTEFASKLIEKADGVMIVKEILPEDTDDGTFTKKIGSLYDYPEYTQSGIHVTLRGTNIIDPEFSSPNNDIVLSGNLANKTQTGIAWLYIFDSINEKSETVIKIPSWIKRNVGWWIDGTITNSEFMNGIEYLLQQEIIVVPETVRQQNSDKIPDWVKQNAALWYEEKIDDKTFASGIQYLISVGIILS